MSFETYGVCCGPHEICAACRDPDPLKHCSGCPLRKSVEAERVRRIAEAAPELTVEIVERCEAAGWEVLRPTEDFACCLGGELRSWRGHVMWAGSPSAVTAKRACTPCLVKKLDAEGPRYVPIANGRRNIGVVPRACQQCLRYENALAKVNAGTLCRVCYLQLGGASVELWCQVVTWAKPGYVACADGEFRKPIEKWSDERKPAESFEKKLSAATCSPSQQMHNVVAEAYKLSEEEIEKKKGREDKALTPIVNTPEHPSEGKGWDRLLGWPGLV